MENKYLSLHTYPGIAATHNGNTQRPYIPFTHKNLKKSLEEIVSNPDPTSKKLPIEDMFSDKAKTLKNSVNAILEEISLRKDLNSHQFNKINGEISNQRNELMQLEKICDNYPFDLTKDLDEAKARLKSNVLELEREKRQERLDCWKDLMFLKKYLMSSLKDYWELSRKREVLNR